MSGGETWGGGGNGPVRDYLRQRGRRCTAPCRRSRVRGCVTSRAMCFGLDSSPPIAPIAGAAVSHLDLSLRSADGTAFAAFEAIPETPGTVGVAILPDVRGLYGFYEELALRFAERGHRAVAFDYF